MVAIVAGSLTLAGCGGSSSTSTGSSGTTTASSEESSSAGNKLIIAGLPYPCALNDYAKGLCEGFEEGGEKLPEGFELEIKTGQNYADSVAFNNLLQTSLELNPSGLIVFPDGEAAQAPVMKEACAQEVKLIVIDSEVTGLEEGCQVSFLGPDNEHLGVESAEWLIAHPPASKEVAVVSQPPGTVSSVDDRVAGFEKTVKAAGYEVVASVSTDLSLDKTRTEVSNMLTAHPNVGAIFSSGDVAGDGTAVAVAHSANPKVVQLTIDGAEDAVERIPQGLTADIAQDPRWLGRESVLTTASAIEGKKVPSIVKMPTKVIDETNAEEYLAEGGLH